MYIFDDGGRSRYFSGSKDVGDCVVRAIAIAMERDYKEVYDDLFERTRHYVSKRRTRVARSIKAGLGATPRDGVHRPVYDAYMRDAGWVWTATMGIGTGCQMHLRPEELPLGRLVVSLSKHLVAVVDGIPRDTHDPTRGGSRCVYGFWQAPAIWSRCDA